MVKGLRQAWCAGLLAAAVLAMPSGAAQAAPEDLPPVTVRVAPVERGDVRLWVTAEGTATALRREPLFFEQSGRVVEIGQEPDGSPLREGSAVHGPQGDQPGQMIARLDDRRQSQTVDEARARARAAAGRVASAEGAVALAENQLKQASAELARTEQLVAQQVLPRVRLTDDAAKVANARAALASRRSELDAARADAAAAEAAANKVLLEGEGRVLFAPFDGLLTFVNIREGEQVGAAPGTISDPDRLMREAAAVIIDPSAFEVMVELPSYESVGIRRGQPAQVTWAGFDLFSRHDASAGAEQDAGALPIAEAEVFAVNPAIRPGSRSVQVRLRTTANPKVLRDGLYVSARIAAQERTGVLTVPLSAVRWDDGAAYAFTVDPETDTAQRRALATGLIDGRNVEVTAGLDEGDLVVVDGHSRLSDGIPVTRVGPES